METPIFQDTSSNHGFIWCDIPDITWLWFENIDGDLIFTYILTIKHVGIEVMNDGWLLQGVGYTHGILAMIKIHGQTVLENWDPEIGDIHCDVKHVFLF
jgi:hypothetical protein